MPGCAGPTSSAAPMTSPRCFMRCAKPPRTRTAAAVSLTCWHRCRQFAPRWTPNALPAEPAHVRLSMSAAGCSPSRPHCARSGHRISRWRSPLLAGEHGLGLALEIDIRIPADVDCDSLDRAAGELPRRLTRVVARHRFTAVAADAQTLARQREHSRLGLDAAFADLLVPVIQGQDPGGNAGRIFSVLGEG